MGDHSCGSCRFPSSTFLLRYTTRVFVLKPLAGLFSDLSSSDSMTSKSPISMSSKDIASLSNTLSAKPNSFWRGMGFSVPSRIISFFAGALGMSEEFDFFAILPETSGLKSSFRMLSSSSAVPKRATRSLKDLV